MAALLYETIFAANASLSKTRQFLLSSKYESEVYQEVSTIERRDAKEKESLNMLDTEAVVIQSNN